MFFYQKKKVYLIYFPGLPKYVVLDPKLDFFFFFNVHSQAEN